MKDFSHIALLGRDKELSIAELEALLGKDNVQQIDKDFAYINTNNGFTLMNRLGGTIKIAAIQGKTTHEADLAEICSKVMEDFYHDAKLKYGINAYPISNESKNLLKSLLKNIKQHLKAKKMKTRYLNKGPQNLHTAQVLEEKLIKKGIELNIFKIENEYIVTNTEGLQDINEYTKRDFGRPARDAKSGMLPPKFAQILINLAKPYLPEGLATIYDPFCGSGTVLQEAILMGYRVLGSDISAKAVEDSEKNLRWLEDKFKIPEGNWEVVDQDATKSSTTSKEFFKKADAIICEGYLGPALNQIHPEEIKKIHEELNKLYKASFKVISEQMQKDSVIVIAIPFHDYNGKYYFLSEISNIIKESGLNKISEYKYKRPQQIVGRQILILKKG